MGDARRAGAALILSCLLVVGCSSDEDPSATGSASPSTAARTSTRGSSTAATPAGTEPLATDTVANDTVTNDTVTTDSVATDSKAPDTVPPTQPTIVATQPAATPTQVPTAEPTGASATEPTDEPAVATPLADDPRTEAGARLATLLPTAVALGVPSDWTVRDLRSGPDEASIPRSELDAFRGVATCPEQLVALDQGGPWAERKFNGVDPDADGVLIVRLQLIEESAADWSQRRQALAECRPASVDAFFENETGSVDVPGSPGGEVELQRVAVFSSAIAEVPFPTQVVSMSANANGTTANVTMFGLNEAEPFDEAVRTLLTELLTAR